ncbi:hypothetical protein BH18VER1_BH18VER1_08900 [soil metagenome]
MAIVLLMRLATMHAAEVPDYNATDASSHAGEAVTVTDTVSRVNSGSGGNIFINMGSGGRDKIFTVFISARSAPEFPNAKAYEGKTITVAGTVTTYKDKQIVVTEPSQIIVKGDAAADTGKTDPQVPPSASPAKP